MTNDENILLGLQTCIARVQQRLDRLERFLGPDFSPKDPPHPTVLVLSPGAFLLKAMRTLQARKYG